MPRALLFALIICGLSFALGDIIAPKAQSLWDRRNVRVVANGTHFVHDGLSLQIQEPGRPIIHEKLTDISQHKRTFPINGWYISLWTFNSYTYYEAQWIVPPIPSYDNGQVLFYFNSLENNPVTDILQPVLQLNNGVAGWTLASWYGVNGVYYESDPFAVSPGDVILGVIALDESTWFIEGYVNGNFETQLQVSSTSVGAQASAQWVNEVYNVDNCASLPSSNSITAGDIFLGVGSSWTEVYPSWEQSIYNLDCSASVSFSSSTATLNWEA